MEQQNLYELCRFCMTKADLKYSLLAESVLEKVESLALIEIKEEDALPTICCEGCLTNICNFYKFKQEILQSDKILRNMLCKFETGPEVLEIVKESPDLFEVLHMDEDDKLIKPKMEVFEEFGTNDGYDPSLLKSECLNDELESPNKDSNVICKIKDDQFVEVKMLNDFGEVNTKDNQGYIIQEKKQNLILTCDKCNKEFPTRRRFQRHLQGHKVEKCPVCPLVIRRDNLKKHVAMHGSPHEICDICGKVAKNRESLRGHIYYTHRDINKQISCEHCGKEFKHNNHYQAHVRNVHLDIRNHQCHLCGKKFSNGYALNKHIKITHECSRPHICQYCKKGFSSPYALKTHVRQHTHETPYPCMICKQAFRQKVSLVTHLKSKHSLVFDNKELKVGIVDPIKQAA